MAQMKSVEGADAAYYALGSEFADKRPRYPRGILGNSNSIRSRNALAPRKTAR
jgi:hypothetical protein